MQIFLDTANVEEIRAAHQLGILAGVTTNPTLVAKEGRDFHAVLWEITSFVKGPVSAEVLSLQADEMVAEARPLAEIAPNIVIKLPMTADGLQAAARLRVEGIKSNVTLVFSANQALLAARAGADFVSPFVGRLDDIGQDGLGLVAEIVQLFTIHDLATQVIAASIRHPQHVLGAALAGADIATVPYKVLQQIMQHPLTDKGIASFLRDWETMAGKGK